MQAYSTTSSKSSNNLNTISNSPYSSYTGDDIELQQLSAAAWTEVQHQGRPSDAQLQYGVQLSTDSMGIDWDGASIVASAGANSKGTATSVEAVMQKKQQAAPDHPTMTEVGSGSRSPVFIPSKPVPHRKHNNQGTCIQTVTLHQQHTEHVTFKPTSSTLQQLLPVRKPPRPSQAIEQQIEVPGKTGKRQRMQKPQTSTPKIASIKTTAPIPRVTSTGPWLFISFDIETTGFSLRLGDRLLEVGFVTMPTVSEQFNQIADLEHADSKPSISNVLPVHQQQQVENNINGTSTTVTAQTVEQLASDLTQKAVISEAVQETVALLAKPEDTDKGLVTAQPDDKDGQAAAEHSSLVTNPSSTDTTTVTTGGSAVLPDSAITNAPLGDAIPAMLQNISWGTLVNPLIDGLRSKAHSQWNQDVHGITSHMVSEAPDTKTALLAFVEQVLQACAPKKYTPVFVAHNGKKFDFPFILAEAKRCGIELPTDWLWVDTLLLARALKLQERFADVSGLGLAALHEWTGHEAAVDATRHRAVADAESAVVVVEHICREVPEAVDMLYKALTGDTAVTFVGLVSNIEPMELPTSPKKASAGKKKTQAVTSGDSGDVQVQAGNPDK